MWQEGQFTNGYRDGNGVLTLKDGTVIKEFLWTRQNDP